MLPLAFADCVSSELLALSKPKFNLGTSGDFVVESNDILRGVDSGVEELELSESDSSSGSLVLCSSEGTWFAISSEVWGRDRDKVLEAGRLR